MHGAAGSQEMLSRPTQETLIMETSVETQAAKPLYGDAGTD